MTLLGRARENSPVITVRDRLNGSLQVRSVVWDMERAAVFKDRRSRKTETILVAARKDNRFGLDPLEKQMAVGMAASVVGGEEEHL